MKIAVIIALLLTITSTVASAESLTGIWRINGLVLFVKHDDSKIVIKTMVRRDDTGLVVIVFDGFVKNESNGSLTIMGLGDEITIVRNNERCKAIPAIMANGQLLGKVPGRIFRAEGSIGIILKCPGQEEVNESELEQLSGIWR